MSENNTVVPVGIEIYPPETIIHWSDKTITTSVPDKKDKYDVVNGVLWCLLKKFMPTSHIVAVIAEALRIVGS